MRKQPLKYKQVPTLIVGFPFQFYLKNQFDERLPAMPPEVSAWCVDQFGEQGARWYGHPSSAHFRDEVDAVNFKLRWG